MGLVNPSTDSKKIAETLRSIRELQEQLNRMFPERETLITQLIYALLTREHVLVFGTYGTGKSLLIGRFFKAFIGGKFFSVELSKYMTESNLIGMPNPKKMREDGIVWYETKNTMIDSDLVELDEVLDANACTLRTTLGILNERRFNRGPQTETAVLHTAVASTNANPEEVVQKTPALGAVIDRFLLQTEVKWLEGDESRCRMLEQYLCGSQPTVQIPFEDVKALAEAVDNVEFNDLAIIKLYNQILQGCKSKIGRVISDRRACQALKLAKANALLSGRQVVSPDDLYATMWAFCYGHDAKSQEDFKVVAKPLIEKAMAELKPDMMNTQMMLLDELEKKLANLKSGNGNGSSAHIPEELLLTHRGLLRLQSDIGKIQPGYVAVKERRDRLLTSVGAASKEVSRLMAGEGAV
ncbi:MAG: AAA family ATPase [Candidatus Nealsonbacteria bacterium]|nr:AAA family ATPase [Candidatus Nealsonbacteria bacterium]